MDQRDEGAEAGGQAEMGCMRRRREGRHPNNGANISGSISAAHQGRPVVRLSTRIMVKKRKGERSGRRMRIQSAITSTTIVTCATIAGHRLKLGQNAARNDA